MVLADRLFTKPSGQAQAMVQLSDLAGRSHELHSEVAVVRNGSILFEDDCRMAMRLLTEGELSINLDKAARPRPPAQRNWPSD
ncbi:hypothetical protein [Bradyrhizobium sp. ISRA442]|uniref:hypothetical protein n=1 Tax=Bradyrhizobium sp. ISRA442 TaxID=2866197 RepID=UPI0040491047